MRDKLQEKGVVVITVEDESSGEIKEIPVADLDDFEEFLVERPTENLRAREGELPSAEAQDISMQAIVAARHKAAELRDERMRQAKFTFNAALALSVIGASIIFIGVGLLLFRDASIAGVLSAATGAVIICGTIQHRIARLRAALWHPLRKSTRLSKEEQPWR